MEQVPSTPFSPARYRHFVLLAVIIFQLLGIYIFKISPLMMFSAFFFSTLLWAQTLMDDGRPLMVIALIITALTTLFYLFFIAGMTTVIIAIH